MTQQDNQTRVHRPALASPSPHIQAGIRTTADRAALLHQPSPSRRRCKLAHTAPTLKYFCDKDKGDISSSWKPLVSVEPNPGDNAPTVHYCIANLADIGIQKSVA